MSDAVEVLRPGARTSVQDLGRFGYQHLGFGVSGAVDQRSLILANQLVGNELGAAAIEATVQGPRLRFPVQSQVAVVGCDPSATLNGESVPANQSIVVAPGDVIEIVRTGGARAYLAIGGGILVPPVMGSRSTDLVGGVGGVNGRPLQAGDRLPYCERKPGQPRMLRSQWVPRRPAGLVAQAVTGPQESLFDQASMETLFATEFSVQPASDSMGLRLKGPSLNPPAEILSEGQPAGAVQIPPSGMPIVLLAGRRTIGGYAKAAVVSRMHLPDLAQLVPGDSIRFEHLRLDDAVESGRRWLDGLLDPSQTLTPL